MGGVKAMEVAEAWLLADGTRWVFLALGLGAVGQFLISDRSRWKISFWPAAFFATGLLLWLTQGLWVTDPNHLATKETAEPAAVINPLTVVISISFQLLLCVIVIWWMVTSPDESDELLAKEVGVGRWLKKLDHLVGWKQQSWPRALGLAFGLGLPTAFLVGQCFFLTGEHWWKPLGFDLKPQPLVKTFSETKDTTLMVAITVAATLLAPICEEFLFRGYLYPAFKKVSGSMVSALAISLAFGLIHGQATTTVPLALLGLCLTLSYEWTRSLKVPILIHMAFNALNLVNLYVGGIRAE